MEKKVTLLQVNGGNNFSVDCTFMPDKDWLIILDAYHDRKAAFVKIFDIEIECYIVEIEIKG